MQQTTPLNPADLPLRDIHLPPAISWWPPAPGWWLLLILTVLFVFVAIWLRERHSRRRYRRLALLQLQQLEQQYQQQNDGKLLLAELSRLLRHAAQLHYPHAGCAGLIDTDWLQFLDQQLASSEFSQGCGQPLASGPYQQQAAAIDGEALLALCRRWLQRLPLAPKQKRRGK